MKKGFTLIELLAVIVILAIIALIATPIVLNIIAKARENSDLRSAEMYLEAVKMSVANSSLEDNIIPDGTYNILEDGDLCIEYSGTTCTKRLEVEVDGNTPKEGTITITNEQISDISIKYNKKTIVKTDKGKVEYKTVLTFNDICTYKGTDANKKFEFGAKYECDLGDGIKRTFYVLEDGDTTTLTTGRIAKANEVSLIMNMNIDTEGKGTTTGNVLALDGAANHLQNATKTWKNVSPGKITLPTVEQIAVAGGDTGWADCNFTEATLSSWLYEYLNRDSAPYAYWVTSTTGCYTWQVRGDVGSIDPADKHSANTGIDVDKLSGVRPVITVYKN